MNDLDRYDSDLLPVPSNSEVGCWEESIPVQFIQQGLNSVLQTVVQITQSSLNAKTAREQIRAQSNILINNILAEKELQIAKAEMKTKIEIEKEKHRHEERMMVINRICDYILINADSLDEAKRDAVKIFVEVLLKERQT